MYDVKVSRKWIEEDFVDLSYVSDKEFAEAMIAMGHNVKGYSNNSHGDMVFELEINSDRPDCLSVIGIAREAAAAFNRPLRCHNSVVNGVDDCSIYERLNVDVPADWLCNRYTARMIRNIKIGCSPEWLCQRLLSNGVQPINNIVDITNYVMLEYGQPIHTFDYNHISSDEIIVREAENGEYMVTADGKTLMLQSGMPVVASGDRIIGQGDIMTAEEFQITDDTTTIVITAANYNEVFIPQTILDLDLRSEFTDRFKKNLDPLITLPALQRACELVEQLDCGEVIDGVIDILNYVPDPRSIRLDLDRINQLLKANLTEFDVASYLNRLGISIEDHTLLLPSFRTDLNTMDDIAAEINRLSALDTKNSASLG